MGETMRVGVFRDGVFRCVFLNGTVGAGKTSVAQAAAALLAADGVPHAVVDLDWLRYAWPAPSGDPFNRDLELANLAALVTNFRAAGPTVLILAGVIEGSAQRQQYELALGCPLMAIRLDAQPATIRDRLRHRHGSLDPALEWHLHRAGELQAILEEANADDAVISTEGRDVSQVATAVIGLATEHAAETDTSKRSPATK
ncbi:AAA family ATPase [Arthrobacter sp. CAN_A1]|uniref:AAA family ATPase n=1 Tax=Arthrobacter sp. CAN_A1 TaxID=2787717 RepID=UPI0018CAF4B6